VKFGVKEKEQSQNKNPKKKDENREEDNITIWQNS
jgi:hypothetical protein